MDEDDAVVLSIDQIRGMREMATRAHDEEFNEPDRRHRYDDNNNDEAPQERRRRQLAHAERLAVRVQDGEYGYDEHVDNRCNVKRDDEMSPIKLRRQRRQQEPTPKIGASPIRLRRHTPDRGWSRDRSEPSPSHSPMARHTLGQARVKQHFTFGFDENEARRIKAEAQRALRADLDAQVRAKRERDRRAGDEAAKRDANDERVVRDEGWKDENFGRNGRVRDTGGHGAQSRSKSRSTLDDTGVDTADFDECYRRSIGYWC